MSLSAEELRAAVAYNQRRLPEALVGVIRDRIGLGGGGGVDDAFVDAVVRWQAAHMPWSNADGRVGPLTEAHLGVPPEEAARAAEEALRLQREGGILFDSWGNDLRDNDLDGQVDEADEQTWDGAHWGRAYGGFGTRRGTYRGGWSGRSSLTVPDDRTVIRPVWYAVCANVVSQAYFRAGVMPQQDSTRALLAQLRQKGHVWRRSEGHYPDEYLPGDFIATWDDSGHGGHSGIVVGRKPTLQGEAPPEVVELPGPSSAMDDGVYDPGSTNDIAHHAWSTFRVTEVPLASQWLGRLLWTLRGRFTTRG